MTDTCGTCFAWRCVASKRSASNYNTLLPHLANIFIWGNVCDINSVELYNTAHKQNTTAQEKKAHASKGEAPRRVRKRRVLYNVLDDEPGTYVMQSVE